MARRERSNALDQQSFTPYILRAKERISSTASIFTLASSNKVGGEDPYQELWETSLWSVQAKQPQLQIARNYTPLPPSVKGDGSVDPTAFRILIRHEINGEMSGYLHRLPLDATIDLRGPYKHLDIDPSTNSLVFCAGGTGIAPAMQCAYALLASNDTKDLPRMHILWANRKREECEGGVSDTVQARGIWDKIWPSTPVQSPVPTSSNAIVEELEALKSRFQGRLTVDYFVDEERSFMGRDALQGSPVLTAVEKSGQVEGSKKALVLVSGPDGFIGHIAGPKSVASNGLEVQGPLGGVLKDMVVGKNVEVWKL
jgi:hypothetical protein